MEIYTLAKIVERKDLTHTYIHWLQETYTTPKGGTLRIKYFITTKHSYLKAVLSCSLCSKDKELWKEGTIVSAKGHLLEGKIPCGCRKGPKLKEWNTEILINRLLNKQNREFIGWNGGWKGFNDTLVRFYDKKHEACFQYTKVKYLLQYPEKDWIKYPAHLTRFKDYTQQITRIKNYHPTYKNYTIAPLNWFYDNSGNKLKFKWECPDCKYKGYSTENTFKNKERICGCFSGKRLTSPDERYTKCNFVCNERKFSLLSEKHELVRSTSPVKWECSNGHYNTWSYNTFTTKDVGCKYCLGTTNYNGFYADKSEEQDTLYFVKFESPEGEEFYKIGRTFVINNRMAVLGKGYKTTIVTTFIGKHRDVYRAEQDTLCEFSEFKYIPEGKSKRTREYLNYQLQEGSLISYLKNRSGIEVE